MAAVLPLDTVGSFRAIAVVLSAAIFSCIALMVFRGVSILEQRALDDKRVFLSVAAERLQAELNSGGEKLPEIARGVARDEELVNATRALMLAVTRSKGQATSARTKAVVSGLMRRLDTRMSALRSSESPSTANAFDALTIVDHRGSVVWTDSKKFESGSSLGSIESSDRLESDPAKGYASVRTMLQKAVDQEVARATWFRSEGDREEIAWLAAATIRSRDGVSGYVMVERELLELPQFQGLTTILVADGEVKLGEAPDGFSPAQSSDDDGRPFLLIEKKASSLVPVLGEVQIPPFLDEGEPRVGIWASRFAIPGAHKSEGYVMTDVTPFFADLGGLQVLTLGLATIAWLFHAVLLSFSGARTAADVSAERSQNPDLFENTETSVDDQSIPDDAEDATFGEEGFSSVSSGDVDELTGGIPEELASIEDFNPSAVEGGHPYNAATTGNSEIPDRERASTTENAPDSGLEPLTGEDPVPSPLEKVESANSDQGSLSELRSEHPLASLPDLKSDVFADAQLKAPRPPEVEAHYREVYAKFMELRKSCGDSTNELSFKRFAEKLDESRADVMAKHASTDVYFSVYLKEGRAALKARPSA